MSKLEKIQEIISKKDSKPQTKEPHPIPSPSVPLPTPSSSNLSRVATKASSKSRSINRKKTAHLQKPKMLYVGDSIAQNADIALVERVTHSRIRTKKAYSSINDTRARWPHKNLTDVTPAALLNTYEEDKFTHLVLAAPTVDISNMNTEKLTKSDNIEVYKQKIAISCENVFTAAQNAIIEHPELDTVIIMKHVPRHDISTVDLTGIKAKLAIFANSTFTQLWHSSRMKDKIVVGRHNLKCKDDMINAWYKDDWSGRFDGVHMYGSHQICSLFSAAKHFILFLLTLRLSTDSLSKSSETENFRSQVKQKHLHRPRQQSV